jgi:hypothetical protein
MIDQLTSYLADVPVWVWYSLLVWPAAATMLTWLFAPMWGYRKGALIFFQPLSGIIALPYLALRTIWRRLGKRKAVGPRYPIGSVVQFVKGDEYRLTFSSDLKSWHVVDPKPAPYASKLPSGTGGKVDSPWVTRDEMRKEIEYYIRRLMDAENGRIARIRAVIDARLDALEAKPKQVEWRGWKFPIPGLRGCNYVIWTPECGDGATWHLTTGNTVWKKHGLWIGHLDEHERHHEIHGTELDALVSEFLEWKGRQS